MSLTKKEELLRRGYEIPEIINPDYHLKEILNRLSTTEIALTHYIIHQSSFPIELKKSRNFLNNYFNFHKIITLKKLYFTKKNVFCFIHPFYLPIEEQESLDIFKGSLAEFFPHEKDIILFKKIILSKPATEHTSIQYTHEITHTQIDSLKELVMIILIVKY